VVSTDCAARRCSAGNALAGIGIATMTSLRHRPTTDSHDRRALADVCTVPVLLTSAKEDKLFVCLFVCMLATLRKNFRSDLHEIFREGCQSVIEQTVKSWWRSGSRSGYRIVFRIRHYWERYGKWYQPTALRDVAVQACPSRHSHSNYGVITSPAHDRQRD